MTTTKQFTLRQFFYLPFQQTKNNSQNNLDTNEPPPKKTTRSSLLPFARYLSRTVCVNPTSHLSLSPAPIMHAIKFTFLYFISAFHWINSRILNLTWWLRQNYSQSHVYCNKRHFNTGLTCLLCVRNQTSTFTVLAKVVATVAARNLTHLFDTKM